MLIPIPSNNRRFTIEVTLKSSGSLTPLSVGFKVFDPMHPHTHYFRRKAYLKPGEKRNIKIPLPVTPEHLELAIYNKRTGDDQEIDILDFKIKLMEDPKFWATPEQRNFLEFAIRFAQKAGYVPAGFYESPDGEYLFQYLPAITDGDGNELVTPARINRKMPRVQISQRMFKTFSIPVRVAILSHEGCHWFLNSRSEKTADLCGIQHYLDYGFPKIEAVYAATKVFGRHQEIVGASQVQRTKDIINFIDNYALQA